MEEKKDTYYGPIFLIGFFIGVLAGLVIHFTMEAVNPSAMDVYQHKTTMEYTVVDGVKQDSTVVFKGNK